MSIHWHLQQETENDDDKTLSVKVFSVIVRYAYFILRVQNLSHLLRNDLLLLQSVSKAEEYQ